MQNNQLYIIRDTNMITCRYPLNKAPKQRSNCDSRPVSVNMTECHYGFPPSGITLAMGSGTDVLNKSEQLYIYPSMSLHPGTSVKKKNLHVYILHR